MGWVNDKLATVLVVVYREVDDPVVFVDVNAETTHNESGEQLSNDHLDVRSCRMIHSDLSWTRTARNRKHAMRLIVLNCPPPTSKIRVGKRLCVAYETYAVALLPI